MRYTLFILGTFFLALKIFGAVAWSWWLVLTPWTVLWVYYTLGAYFIVYILSEYIKRYPDDVIKLNEYLKKRKINK